mgnify:CR=1 FL=1
MNPTLSALAYLSLFYTSGPRQLTGQKYDLFFHAQAEVTKELNLNYSRFRQ